MKTMTKLALSGAALHAWVRVQRRERFFVSIDFGSLGCTAMIFSAATCFAAT
jgi:hypothetical protein